MRGDYKLRDIAVRSEEDRRWVVTIGWRGRDNSNSRKQPEVRSIARKISISPELYTSETTM